MILRSKTHKKNGIRAKTDSVYLFRFMSRNVRPAPTADDCDAPPPEYAPRHSAGGYLPKTVRMMISDAPMWRVV